MEICINCTKKYVYFILWKEDKYVYFLRKIFFPICFHFRNTMSIKNNTFFISLSYIQSLFSEEHKYELSQ